MPDPHDGPQPAEGTEGPFAKLNRKTSTLDRLMAAYDGQIANLERRLDAQTQRMDRWGREFADLMDELVRRLRSTSEHLSRVDGTLSGIAEHHPESEPEIAALRTDLHAEAQRFDEHVDLMCQTAYRVYGLEPANPEKPSPPLIPYDRKLSRNLTSMLWFGLLVSALLQLTRLLPLPGDADRVIAAIAPHFDAFAVGVGITHLVLRRRARAYERDRKA